MGSNNVDLVIGSFNCFIVLSESCTAYVNVSKCSIPFVVNVFVGLVNALGSR
jgi:hypothetical protein